MAKLVKTEEQEMKSAKITYSLKMVSGDKHRVLVEPYISKCYFNQYYNPDRNPFYIVEAIDVLRTRIEKGFVVDDINYGLVESFEEVESKVCTEKVYKSVYKGWSFETFSFGTHVKWSTI